MDDFAQLSLGRVALIQLFTSGKFGFIQKC